MRISPSRPRSPSRVAIVRAEPTPRRVFAVTLIGVLLAQAAWILAMPAFRGIDEFDHVHKAAAVARGQWTDSGAAQDGRGGYVRIPGSIVRSATEVCEFYRYTGPDNCRAVEELPNGDVVVATAASAYNPAYYLIVGTFARPFGGAGADYAMRALTAVMCALMLAWSAAIIARWATSLWPLVTFVLGVTPVLVYSTTIAGPNGLTYAGAALVWASLAATTRLDSGTGNLALPATLGSIALVATHTTGPMWLALIVLAVAILQPVRGWLTTFRRDRLAWSAAAVTLAIITLLCLIWVRYAKTNALGSPLADVDPLALGDLVRAEILWPLQAIAAFPTRNEPAPVVVYALWGIPLTAMLVILVRRSSGRLRAALALVVLSSILVPTILTILSYERIGGIAWQGRYSLPLLLGLPILAGLAMDRRPEPSRSILHVLAVLTASATVISTVHVGRTEDFSASAAALATRFDGGLVLVGALALAGALTMFASMNARSASRARSESPEPALEGARE